MRNIYRLFTVLLFSIVLTTLAIAGPTPSVGNIVIGNITDTSVKISFDINQSNARTVIHYGISSGNLDKLSNWNNDTGWTRYITIDGLSPKAKYYLSVYVYNGNNSNYFTKSSILDFTTTGTANVSSITAPNITSINVGNINDTSAEVTFTVNQSDADTIINYGTTTSFNKKSGWNNNTGTTRTIKLSNLLNNTKYYLSIFAYNGTNQNYYTNSPTRNFTTSPSTSDNGTVPKIISKSPSEKVIHTAAEEKINFTVTFDQAVNVTWLLNGPQVKKNDFIKSSYYLNNTSSIGTWNVTVKWSNKNGSDSYSWAWIVDPKTYGSGNRIWDGTKGMSTTYTWNSYSFAGFYYNLNRNQGTEELTITDIDRNIGEGDIIYKTSPVEVSFDYSSFGKYQVIGFMADKYFAGYTSNSTISDSREISSMGSGQLHKVLIDNEDKRTVSVGGTLSLKEGYVLKMKEIDIGAGTGQIWISLLKDGGEVDNTVISAKETYVYKKRVGTVDNLPIIAVHFDSVFRGVEVNAAFIRGIFQISDSYTNIDSNSRYGKMEISNIAKDKITMKNRETIRLSAGDVIDLMGDLKITVADSDTLRFGLSVDRTGITGTFEARGTIYPVVNEWTPLNFGLDIGGKNVGFYYDIDEDIGTEKLSVKNINGRSIQEGNLIYSTSPQEVSFDYSSFGKYNVIGFMADKYFAGYTSKSTISGGSVDTIGSGQLHRVLVDDDDQRVITVGGTLSLKEGYVLKAKEIDIGAGTGQIWVTLLKDGNEIDNDVVAAKDTYVYKKKVGSVDNLPIIAVHMDSVFRGRELNAAFIRGIFQISDSYTEAKNGNTYGKMEISGVSKNQIAMKNKDDISLSSGSTIDLMGNIKFKVADSSSVRFYPFVLVTQDMMTNQLIIGAPSKTNAGNNISVNITAGGIPIEGVSISIEPQVGLIGNTDESGTVDFTLPTTLTGTYTIVATKLGYQKANKTINVEKYIEKRLNINVPINTDQFKTISIQATSDNIPVNGVTIAYDNKTIGTTDNNGTLNYMLELSGNHIISASKTGYITTNREIYVREPFSEFKSLDINITPGTVFENEEILIKSNITNIGTKADARYVELIVNNVTVGNESITISPNDIKEISFTYKPPVEGNYTIEIFGQKGLLEVKKAPYNIPLTVAIITIISIIVAYMIASKDKIAELIRKNT